MAVEPLNLIETEQGSYSLLLVAGATPVDETIEELGHEPNGYFWEGVAQFVIETTAPDLTGRLDFDSEGGTFCAYGADRSALEELGTRLAALANEAQRLRDLVVRATDAGFEFDD